MRKLPVGRLEGGGTAEAAAEGLKNPLRIFCQQDKTRAPGGTLLKHSCQLAFTGPMLTGIAFYGLTLQLLTCTAATASKSKSMYLGAISIFV